MPATDAGGALHGKRIAVYGAYGHTGRFIVAELIGRGGVPVLAGRDAGQLAAMAETYPGLDVRPASVDDAAALDRALAGADAVINAAGPYLDTAAPVIKAALRARVPYLDLAAEQAAALAVFERYDAAARDGGVVLMPAMAFFGGFADLLATAAMQDWTRADRIDVAIALDSWQPTRGTRITGERNTVPRVQVSGGRHVPLPSPPAAQAWPFPAPVGTQDVLLLPLSEMILLPRHLDVPEIRSWMTSRPLADLRDPATPPPTAADARGRSAQTFVIDVAVRQGRHERRACAHGQDIYAVSAPLIVEATQRLLARPGDGGVFAPGQCFDAAGFLRALAPEHFSLTLTAR